MCDRTTYRIIKERMEDIHIDMDNRLMQTKWSIKASNQPQRDQFIFTRFLFQKAFQSI